MEKYEVMHIIIQNTTYDVSANYKKKALEFVIKSVKCRESCSLMQISFRM